MKRIVRELRVSRIEAVAPLVRAIAEVCARSFGLTRQTSAMSASGGRCRGSGPAGADGTVPVVQRGQVVAGTADADPDLRRPVWAWLRGWIRCCPTVRAELVAEPGRRNGGCPSARTPSATLSYGNATGPRDHGGRKGRNMMFGMLARATTGGLRLRSHSMPGGGAAPRACSQLPSGGAGLAFATSAF